jgi:hypothetical protein
MSEFTVSKLIHSLKKYPKDLPVYFRKIAPCIGNIEMVGMVNLDSYQAFGRSYPCVIIEPYDSAVDEED